MNLRDEILTLPTVHKVEIDKDVEYRGQPCIQIRVETLHPKTGKTYEHVFEFVKKTIPQTNIPEIVSTYLENWWEELNLGDALDD